MHYYRIKDYKNALNYYFQFKNSSGYESAKVQTKAVILNRIGICHFQLENPDIAIDYFNQALKLASPRIKSDLYFDLGKAYLEKKDRQQALAYFQQASKLTITYLDLLKKTEFSFNGPLQSKKRTFIQEKESARRNLLYLGDFLYKNGFLDTAENCYENAIAIAPKFNNYAVYFKLGAINLRRQNYDKAVLNFKKASEDPDLYQDAMRFISMLYEKAGQKTKP